MINISLIKGQSHTKQKLYQNILRQHQRTELEKKKKKILTIVLVMVLYDYISTIEFLAMAFI